MDILRQYEKDDYIYTEYTEDGITATHIVKELKSEPMVIIPTSNPIEQMQKDIDWLILNAKGLV